tara:strand:- start:8324 stop:8782 length:459 start_codon:yes stop_codon:yes gene_type:complete
MKSLNKIFKLADRFSYKLEKYAQAESLTISDPMDVIEKFPQYFAKVVNKNTSGNHPIFDKLDAYLSEILTAEESVKVIIQVGPGFKVNFDVNLISSVKQSESTYKVRSKVVSDKVKIFLNKQMPEFNPSNLEKLFPGKSPPGLFDIVNHILN